MELGDSEAHVWLVPLDLSRARPSLLTLDEQERASRYRAADARDRFVVARATLREILGRYAGLPPERLRFDYPCACGRADCEPSQRKPRLAPETVRFNISHADGLALVAVAREREVGVDVEEIRPGIELASVARHVLGADEAEALAALPERERLDAFYRRWTRREAHAKARGDGLAPPGERTERTRPVVAHRPHAAAGLPRGARRRGRRVRRGDPLVAVTENPVSLTAYWTLAIRDRDARSEHPIAADTFAHRLMDARAREIAEQFSTLKKPNMTLPVRHRLIDDRLAAELARDPALRVVVIGAGYDTRAFRLGGGRWLELDEPAVIARKEAALPATEAQNALVRIPIRFAEESLEEKLAPFAAAKRVAVVLEGILNYLRDEQTRELLAVLKRLFPRHVVLADMLGRRFIAIYSRALVKRLKRMGIEFVAVSESPEPLFHAAGYRTATRDSIFQWANELGAAGALPLLAVRFLPSLRDGYCVWSFEYEGSVNGVVPGRAKPPASPPKQ